MTRKREVTSSVDDAGESPPDKRSRVVPEAVEMLRKPLGPEFVSQRAGPRGAGKLFYLSSADAITAANAIFGNDGWSSTVVGDAVVEFDREQDKWVCRARVTMRVTVRWLSEAEQRETHHEDVGFGGGKKLSSKAEAEEVAVKEAHTDAVKRALRKFGDGAGNCLYEKAYLNWIQGYLGKTKDRFAAGAVSVDGDLLRKPGYSFVGGKVVATRPAVVAGGGSLSSYSSASTLKEPVFSEEDFFGSDDVDF
jgi:DNA repair and recombination protein RAD52